MLYYVIERTVLFNGEYQVWVDSVDCVTQCYGFFRIYSLTMSSTRHYNGDLNTENSMRTTSAILWSVTKASRQHMQTWTRTGPCTRHCKQGTQCKF